MSVATQETLKQRYKDVLCEFERFSFSEEQIRINQGLFEIALNDLHACQKCTCTQVKEFELEAGPGGGKKRRFTAVPDLGDKHRCRSSAGYGMYLALSERLIRKAGKPWRPMFAAFQCNPLERKRQIRDMWLANVEVYEEEPNQSSKG